MSALSSSRPHLVAITSRKGGSGKTTLALNLAEALSASGISCIIIDLDQRANARMWASAVEASGHSHYFNPVTGIVPLTPDKSEEGISTVSEAISIARATGSTVVLADCPSRADFRIDTILRSADIVLVPTNDSALDHGPTAVMLGHLLNLRQGEPDFPVALVPVLEAGQEPSADLRKLTADIAPTIHRDAAFRTGMAPAGTTAADEVAALAGYLCRKLDLKPSLAAQLTAQLENVA